MKKIEIYFGVGKDRDGNEIRPEVREGALDEARYRASCEFQGCTLIRTQGDWYSPRLGIVVTEPGALLVLIVEDSWPGLDAGISAIVAGIKGMLNQESVYVVTSVVKAVLL